MIRITYQLRSEASPRHMDLSPENYFDPLCDGETYDEDGVPRFNHVYEYTGYDADELKWTVVKDGPEKGSVVRTQFLDGNRSRMTHRADADGYEEIIHSTDIGENGWLILRTIKMPGQAWSVIMSTYSIDDDSFLKDNHIGWSSEEMQAFCGIGDRT